MDKSFVDESEGLLGSKRYIGRQYVTGFYEYVVEADNKTEAKKQIANPGETCLDISRGGIELHELGKCEIVRDLTDDETDKVILNACKELDALNEPIEEAPKKTRKKVTRRRKKAAKKRDDEVSEAIKQLENVN